MGCSFDADGHHSCKYRNTHAISDSTAWTSFPFADRINLDRIILMEHLDIAIVALVVVAFALVSGRISSTPVTGPMIFVVCGFVLGPDVLDLVNLSLDNEIVLFLAEVTLALLLFSDAARIDVKCLASQHSLPIRMLGIGLPLTIVLGAVLAIPLFPDDGIWELFLIAAILAPTDAALGQVVVSSPRIPVRIRQALNVEGGLNDGIAAPLVTIFAALVIAEQDFLTAANVTRFIAEQIGFGLIAGVGIGAVGALLVRRFSKLGWMDGVFRQLAILALAIGAWALAIAIGGNGFVAAFCGGLTFGALSSRGGMQPAKLTEFTEDEGQLLALITFLIFGGTLVGRALIDITWQVVVYAVLSLTVIRMLPVALSLTGTHVSAATKAFLGWFGPRGLASIIFALVVVEESGMHEADDLLDAVTLTVLFSVFAHGFSATPLSNWYAGLAEHPDNKLGLPERAEVHEHPVRYTPMHLRKQRPLQHEAQTGNDPEDV